MSEPDPAARVIDLLQPGGPGPVWGTASTDLNATLLAWPAGKGTPAHVNEERDVLVVVVDGAGVIRIDGTPHAVHAATALLVHKGCEREISAGPEGIRYLTVHLRRAGLQIAPAPSGGGTPGAPRAA